VLRRPPQAAISAQSDDEILQPITVQIRQSSGTDGLADNPGDIAAYWSRRRYAHEVLGQLEHRSLAPGFPDDAKGSQFCAKPESPCLCPGLKTRTARPGGWRPAGNCTSKLRFDN
jgi:hypothetical protein